MSQIDFGKPAPHRRGRPLPVPPLLAIELPKELDERIFVKDAAELAGCSTTLLFARHNRQRLLVDSSQQPATLSLARLKEFVAERNHELSEVFEPTLVGPKELYKGPMISREEAAHRLGFKHISGVPDAFIQKYGQQTGARSAWQLPADAVEALRVQRATPNPREIWGVALLAEDNRSNIEYQVRNGTLPKVAERLNVPTLEINGVLLLFARRYPSHIQAAFDAAKIYRSFDHDPELEKFWEKRVEVVKGLLDGRYGLKGDTVEQLLGINAKTKRDHSSYRFDAVQLGTEMVYPKHLILEAVRKKNIAHEINPLTCDGLDELTSIGRTNIFRRHHNGVLPGEMRSGRRLLLNPSGVLKVVSSLYTDPAEKQTQLAELNRLIELHADGKQFLSFKLNQFTQLACRGTVKKDVISEWAGVLTRDPGRLDWVHVEEEAGRLKSLQKALIESRKRVCPDEITNFVDTLFMKVSDAKLELLREVSKQIQADCPDISWIYHRNIVPTRTKQTWKRVMPHQR